MSLCDYSNLMTYDRLYKPMKRLCFLYHSIYLIDSHGIVVVVVVVVQSPNHVLLSVTPWTEACHTSLSFTNSLSLLNLMSIESVMPSNHFILCHSHLLLPSVFQASESFPVNCLFASGDQSIGLWASASVLPMNIQGSYPLGLTVLIALQFKGLSRVFSSTTIWKHQFFGAQPSL